MDNAINLSCSVVKMFQLWRADSNVSHVGRSASFILCWFCSVAYEWRFFLGNCKMVSLFHGHGFSLNIRVVLTSWRNCCKCAL